MNHTTTKSNTIQKFSIAILFLAAVGLATGLIVLSREKDRQIEELSHKIRDLSEGNARAQDALDRASGPAATGDAGADSVALAEHEALLERYQALSEQASRMDADLDREIGRLREELADERAGRADQERRIGELSKSLEQKRELLARMEGDRLSIIEQIMALEDYLETQETRLDDLEVRFEEQDELLAELKRRDAEHTEQLRKILEALKNRN